jgi:hypothetical protein
MTLFAHRTLKILKVDDYSPVAPSVAVSSTRLGARLIGRADWL